MDSWHASCFHGGVVRRAAAPQSSGADSVGQLRAALRHQTRIAEALREVGAALGPSEDLDEVLELLLSKTQELLESDRATLFLLDETTGELVSRIVGGDEIRSVRLRVGYGIAGHVAESGRTLRIRDAYADPRFEPQWDQLTSYRTRSMLATPLRNHVGAIIGVLQVLNKRGAEEFTSEDEELVIALSSQAAVVIDNSRLVLRLKENNRQLLDAQEALERRVRDLQLLFDLERATAHATNMHTLVDAVLTHVVPACDAEAGVMLVAEEDGEFVLFTLADRKVGLVRETCKRAEGLLRSAMDAEGVLTVIADEEAMNSMGVRLGSRPRSVVAAPLDGETQSMGSIAFVGKRRVGAFGADDLELIRLVSANVSTAMRLYRAAAAHERSERLTAIGTLLSQVIHDFKTPMTVISGYSQLMVDETERHRRAAYTEEIVRQFEIITAMQREVLEFARGERSLFARRIALGRFYDEFSREVSRELEGTAVELVLDVDRKAIARFDEVRMTRALHNLVRNAIEAMAGQVGRLTLLGRREVERLVLSVEDTGPGIPKQIEGSLFQSFVTANKKGGSGLGLAIVKKIVDEHNGRIEVESSSHGTKFTIFLPQLPDARPQPDSARPTPVVVDPRPAPKRPSSRPPPR
jgi:nitrogen-specific signal transduction histidine kinase/putative methionine-R-sulfoxide reductase with GAF domain